MYQADMIAYNMCGKSRAMILIENKKILNINLPKIEDL